MKLQKRHASGWAESRETAKTFFWRLMFYSCVCLGTRAQENDFLSLLSRRTWKCHHLFGFRGVFGGSNWRVWWCFVIWGARCSHNPALLYKQTFTNTMCLYLLRLSLPVFVSPLFSVTFLYISYFMSFSRWYAGPVEVAGPSREDQRQPLQAEGDRWLRDRQSRPHNQIRGFKLNLRGWRCSKAEKSSYFDAAALVPNKLLFFPYHSFYRTPWTHSLVFSMKALRDMGSRCLTHWWVSCSNGLVISMDVFVYSVSSFSACVKCNLIVFEPNPEKQKHKCTVGERFSDVTLQSSLSQSHPGYAALHW